MRNRPRGESARCSTASELNTCTCTPQPRIEVNFPHPGSSVEYGPGYQAGAAPTGPACGSDESVVLGSGSGVVQQPFNKAPGANPSSAASEIKEPPQQEETPATESSLILVPSSITTNQSPPTQEAQAGQPGPQVPVEADPNTLVSEDFQPAPQLGDEEADFVAKNAAQAEAELNLAAAPTSQSREGGQVPADSNLDQSLHVNNDQEDTPAPEEQPPSEEQTSQQGTCSGTLKCSDDGKSFFLCGPTGWIPMGSLTFLFCHEKLLPDGRY